MNPSLIQFFKNQPGNPCVPNRIGFDLFIKDSKSPIGKLSCKLRLIGALEDDIAGLAITTILRDPSLFTGTVGVTEGGCWVSIATD